MGDAIEFVGRIGRSDGKLVAAGRFDLAFRLFSDRSGNTVLWSEDHEDVPVGVGGGFQVVLGLQNPLVARIFSVTPRWLSVLIRKDEQLIEAGDRVPLMGAAVRFSDDLAALRDALDESVRNQAETTLPFPAGENIDAPARRRLIKLHRRLSKLERGEGLLTGIRTRLAATEARVQRLDDDDHGRVQRLEDEVEDIVGPNGDILDLLERIEALEQGRVATGVEPPTPVVDARSEARLAVLEERVATLRVENDALRKSLELLLVRLGKPAAQVETVPGPLTVQKGGLHVANGGLLVHEVEGRVPGASRREGTLFLNPRSGGDVVVGNKESGGLVATGSIRAGRAMGLTRTIAVRVAGPNDIAPGTVVAMDERKRNTTARVATSRDTPLGVVVEHAAVELGEGTVLVAVVGLVRVKVSGPVVSGDALVAGDGGAVVRPEGDARPSLGRAVGRLLSVAPVVAAVAKAGGAVVSKAGGAVGSTPGGTPEGAAGDNGEIEVLLFAP